MPSEAAAQADFSKIRYAQCWEDADILLEALDIRPGDVCLSIASAGDNALAMLGKGPAKVIALDLSPAQLACLELRVAAYRALRPPELLTLIGSTPGDCRPELYQRCRPLLSSEARAFWDAHPDEIAHGIGGAGKFERYFGLFRTRILPLIHSRRKVERLLGLTHPPSPSLAARSSLGRGSKGESMTVSPPSPCSWGEGPEVGSQAGSTPEEREAFYDREWDTWRWRLLFRVFFSRFVMGRAGRDPSFFRYVEGSVAERILARTRYALTALNPAENPYLQWILTGRHTTALPYALRPENFEAIRAHLDRLEWRCQSLEDYLDTASRGAIDRYNLSDIFEYMSQEITNRLLERLAGAGRSGGRLAYWNMLAPRRRPESLAHRLRPLEELANRLHRQDKAFFYSAFIVEEIV